MAVAGYDVFFAKPGEIMEQTCRVCGSRCTVRRNVSVPATRVGTISDIGQVHDSFLCPHADEVWHDQALALLEFLDQAPGENLAMLLKADINRIIKNNL